MEVLRRNPCSFFTFLSKAKLFYKWRYFQFRLSVIQNFPNFSLKSCLSVAWRLLRHKTIASQNAPSEVLIKKCFYFPEKSHVSFLRFSIFCILKNLMNFQICDVIMSVSTWENVHFWINIWNHSLLGKGIRPTHNHHHHSFNVLAPLRVGCMAPMFVLVYFSSSIQFSLQDLPLLTSSFCDHRLSYLPMPSLVYLVHGVHQHLLLLCC